jgi:DNA-binding SARP family transcriptional activator
VREATPLRIVTLGGFRLLHEGRPVPASAWRSRKARDLLRLLVANRGRPAPRDALMETLWPEDDPALLPNRLSVLLATIRHVLDPERAHPPDHYIAAEQGAVALRIERIEVDVIRFLDLAAQALQDDDPELLDAAERLYGGEFLAEDAYEDWATPLRDEVRNAYVGVARALARHAPDSDTAARYLERVLDRDRYDEEAHLELIGRLERAGRHGEARRRYAAYASRMDEIGVDPAPLPRD